MTAIDAPLDQSASLSPTTAELIQAHLDTARVRLSIKTGSMSPALRVGDQVIIRKAAAEQLRLGDIVVLKSAGTLVAHRLIARRQQDGQLLLVTKGDACADADSPWHPSALVGVIAAVQRGGRETSLETRPAKIVNRMLAFVSDNHRIMNQRRNGTARKLAAKSLRGGLKALALLLTIVFGVLFVLPSSEVSAAVTVSSFTVKAQGNQVQVMWTTASEINNVGFDILRSNSQTGTYSKLNSSIIPSQCLGCITGGNYSYTDISASPGQTYFFKLQSVDNNGGTHQFGPATASTSGPTATPTNLPSTATQTSTATVRAATNTSIPAKTSTSTSAPATSTPNRTAISSHSQSAATYAPPTTPPTQVAVALPVATFTHLAPSVPARPISTAQPSAPAQAAPAPSVIDEPQDPVDEAVPEQQPVASPSASPDLVLGFALFGVAGALGCGSALSGGLAILVFARSITRR